MDSFNWLRFSWFSLVQVNTPPFPCNQYKGGSWVCEPGDNFLITVYEPQKELQFFHCPRAGVLWSLSIRVSGIIPCPGTGAKRTSKRVCRRHIYLHQVLIWLFWVLWRLLGGLGDAEQLDPSLPVILCTVSCTMACCLSGMWGRCTLDIWFLWWGTHPWVAWFIEPSVFPLVSPDTPGGLYQVLGCLQAVVRW